VRHIGHEIRNPLNTIQGLLEVLQIELKPFRDVLQENIFEIITTCRESCSLGKEIISDLVAFEQIAAGKYTLELSHTSILNYVYESIRPFIVAARAKRVNVVLQKRNCVETTMVNIDLMKMGQVMRNVLSNAVKFCKAGGEVVVTVTEEGAVVTVAVTDQGPGMTEEQIGRLFQEGVQFEPNKHQNGYVGAIVWLTDWLLYCHWLVVVVPAPVLLTALHTLLSLILSLSNALSLFNTGVAAGWVCSSPQASSNCTKAALYGRPPPEKKKGSGAPSTSSSPSPPRPTSQTRRSTYPFKTRMTVTSTHTLKTPMTHPLKARQTPWWCRGVRRQTPRGAK
jgi:hypothetical protein